MKKLSLPIVFTVVALATVVAFAQSPTTPPSPAAAPRAPRIYPAPTNLKALPKDLTGQQVHEVMEKWESELGARCNSCHTADPTNLGPNGRPRLKFEDDSKDEKVVARLMFAMTEELNKKYFGQMKHDDDHGKMPSITCSTCHRGHMHPEEFVAPKEEHGGPMPALPPVPAQK